MAKYNKRIVMHITGLVSSDSYTITEICELVGISESTFHEWKKTKAEFSDALKKASEKFDESCVSGAKKSLIKMAGGYDVTETKTVYSNIDNTPIVKEQTETTKHIQPSLGAAIFILTNKDPDNWKNRQNIDNNVTGNGKGIGVRLIFADTPLAEKDIEEIKRIRNGEKEDSEDACFSET